MTTLVKPSELDLTVCDREPIHVPGSVQAHGWLLACGVDDWFVTHVSENLGTLCRPPASSWIGRDLRAVLGDAAAAEAAAVLTRTNALGVAVGRTFGVRVKGRKDLFDMAVHQFGGRRLVELERSTEPPGWPPLDLVRAVLSRVQQAQTLHDLCTTTCEQLRDLLGFDRTMIYRFLADGSGEVIAESRERRLPPYLHLRYPASDIPRQARELYLKNWVRLIADVRGQPARLLSARFAADAPLDLTHADLRSVSPVHIEYLRNMRVGASMSISIVVNGQLWGLIACHHTTERHVPSNLRAAAELLGQVFSLQIQTVEGIEAFVTMRAARSLLDRVIADFPTEGDLVENLAARFAQVRAFMPSDGVGALVDGAWRAEGSAPIGDEAAAFVRFLDARPDHGVVAIDALPAAFPPAAGWSCGACGALAIPLSAARGAYLVFFRRELAQTIAWGGDPRKPASESEPGRLAPRLSFEAWKEEVRGQASPWTSRQKLMAETMRLYLLDVIVRFRDVLLEERRLGLQRQRLAAAELHQRVKGTLELVRSLVVRGYEEAGSLGGFVRALEARIRAVGLAHETTLHGGETAQLRTLLEGALAIAGVTHRGIELRGPDVRLDAKASTTLALVLHELVTNAVQHGALSTPEGRLAVRWWTDPAGAVALAWEESGGPPVMRAARDGLGWTIVRRKIPYELGGHVDLHAETMGVRVRLDIPARHVAAASIPAAAVQAGPAPELLAHALQGYSVLVVEDELLNAIEVERMLRERGAAQVETAATVAAALESIAAAPPDVALLDLHVGRETSLVVAEELARQGIPYVFAFGPGEQLALPPEHRDDNVIAKPYDADAVAIALKDAVMPYMIRSVLTKLI
jgi:light-regulated signal transduction histidine kinase (bacteriophytochrome)